MENTQCDDSQSRNRSEDVKFQELEDKIEKLTRLMEQQSAKTKQKKKRTWSDDSE